MDIWLVAWTPLKNDGVRQLGWWNSHIWKKQNHRHRGINGMCSSRPAQLFWALKSRWSAVDMENDVNGHHPGRHFIEDLKRYNLFIILTKTHSSWSSGIFEKTVLNLPYPPPPLGYGAVHPARAAEKTSIPSGRSPQLGHIDGPWPIVWQIENTPSVRQLNIWGCLKMAASSLMLCYFSRKYDDKPSNDPKSLNDVWNGNELMY